MLPYPRAAACLLLLLCVGSTVCQERAEEQAVESIDNPLPLTDDQGEPTPVVEEPETAAAAAVESASGNATVEVVYEYKPFLMEFPNGTCPNLQGAARLHMLAKYQCPGRRSWYSCIDDLLELPEYRRFRCRPILFRWEKTPVNRTVAYQEERKKDIVIRPEEVHMANNMFLAALKERGRHGSHFCMLMMFYSPSCPFSARWAPFFNALPPRYNNILFVAVNASDPANNRMNTRLGVIGTPSMVLYVDGAPVARVDETADPAEHLPKFIESLTDWHTDGPLVENALGNVQVDSLQEGYDQWLLLSLVVYTITCVYHVVAYTWYGARKWRLLLQRLRGEEPPRPRYFPHHLMHANNLL